MITINFSLYKDKHGYSIMFFSNKNSFTIRLLSKDILGRSFATIKEVEEILNEYEVKLTELPTHPDIEKYLQHKILE